MFTVSDVLYSIIAVGGKSIYIIHDIPWSVKTGAVNTPSLIGLKPYLSITPPESPERPLLGANESNSSKKMTHGAALRALWKTAKNGMYYTCDNHKKLVTLIFFLGSDTYLM